VAALQQLGPAVTLTPDTLVLRGAQLTHTLPDILHTLHTAGITAGDIRLRENSLEDVFIALTGRRLRE
jgi:hypothetical protein